ncbi:hypothetical protein WDW86_18525 [Bdellovibrionota bacterium FG-2]
MSPLFKLSTESFPPQDPFTQEALAAFQQWNEGPEKFKFQTSFQANLDADIEPNTVMVTDDGNLMPEGAAGVAYASIKISLETEGGLRPHVLSRHCQWFRN